MASRTSPQQGGRPPRREGVSPCRQHPSPTTPTYVLVDEDNGNVFTLGKTLERILNGGDRGVFCRAPIGDRAGGGRRRNATGLRQSGSQNTGVSHRRYTAPPRSPP